MKIQHNTIYTTFFSFLLTLFVALVLMNTAQAFHYPWDQGHDVTDWNDPDGPGPCEGPNCDPCKSTGSPVYIPTGHFIWSESDIALAGRPQISVTRTYNSHDPRDGIFGNGWASNCESVMTKVNNTDSTSSYFLRMANGKRYEYKQQTDGTFLAPAGRFDSVSVVSGGGIRLTSQSKGYKEFNTAGRLVTSADANGVSKNYTYDSSGRITKISSDSRSVTLTYDSNGRVTNIQDHSGRTWVYAYDANGSLISVTDPLGGIRQFEYQAYTDVNDGFTYYQLTKITDESGVVVTQVTYNKSRVSSYTNGSNTFNYSYNVNSKTVTKTDSAGARYTTVYNNDQVVIKRTNPLSNSIQYEYDNDGNVIKFTDRGGSPWLATYDSKGRKLSSVTPLGKVTQWGYQGASNKTNKITTPENNIILITYNNQLNPLSITDANGITSDLAYDNKGNIVSVTDAKGNKTTFSYNGMNLVTRITDANNSTNTLSYDDLGRNVSVTDAEGRTTSFEYDLLDRLINSTNALGHITQYGYDAEGRLLQLIDPGGNITSTTYDINGRLVKETRPDGKETTFVYDSSNLLTTVNRYDGKVVDFTYDSAKRLVSNTVDGDAININYDARGNRTQLSNTTTTVKYTYDIDGDQIGEDQAGVNIIRVYNKDGALTQLKALGQTRQYTRDKTNALSSLVSGSINFDFLYDENSILKTINLPNNLTETYQYDKIYNLSQLKTGANILDYSHDKTGLIISKTRNGTNIAYSFDAITRLTQAGIDSYNYDVSGNNLNNGAKYDIKTNRLTEDAINTYSYDTSGNLTQKKKKDLSITKSYTYSSRNLLTKVESLDGSGQTTNTLEFTYDPLNRRFIKIKNNVITRYIYDGQDIIATFDSNNNLVTSIIHGDTVDTPLSIQSNGQTYYYHRNHQGSIISLTDSSGSEVESYSYDAYGVTTKSNSVTTGNPYAYTGREFDDDDLYYYRARYYDPTTQRFLSEDPIGFESGDYNLYRYVNNNPVNMSDPSGEFGLVGFAIGLGFDVALQLIQNGGNLKCINVGQALLSGALGAVGAGIGSKLAGTKGAGKVFSHWVPSRAKNWPGFGGKLGKKFLKTGNKSNGNYVTKKRHYKHDNKYYGHERGDRTLRQNEWGNRWSQPFQQLDRVPNVHKGAIAGGAAGNAAGNAAGGDCDECQ